MSEELKRAELTRQMLEDVVSDLKELLHVLNPTKDRMLMFESMIVGRVELLIEGTQGTLSRVRQFEQFRKEKNKEDAPPKELPAPKSK